MKPYEKYRRIKMAKAKKIYSRRYMTEEQLIKKNELERKVGFIDQYKLAPIKDMIDACKMADVTRAKVIIHCSGQQVAIEAQQGIEVLKEASRVILIERQQLIHELEHL